MSFPDRYYSLFKRQEAKLTYAPQVIVAFEKARSELGSFPSQTELAVWLTGRIDPSAKRKTGSKWTAQTVRDWTAFDGLPPTEERIRGYYAEAEHMNKSQRSKLTRSYGSRVALVLEWNKVRATILRERGEERLAFEEQRLAAHLGRTSETARALRRALGMPED